MDARSNYPICLFQENWTICLWPVANICTTNHKCAQAELLDRPLTCGSICKPQREGVLFLEIANVHKSSWYGNDSRNADHAPDARMLILLTCENFPVKTLRGLARRHNAHTVIDPNSNMAAITVAYDHNRVESVLGMLANARIEVSRQNASLESIVKAVRKTKHYQPIVF